MKGGRTILALSAAVPVAIAFCVPAQQKVSYSKQIAPIMKAHCMSCHGEKTPAANLNLTSLNGVRHPQLLERVLGHGGKPRMPLGFAPLKADEIALLELWVKEGANGDEGKSLHWAYVPPTLPAIPKVKDKAWVRNPIDSFILAKLERLKKKPSPEASRETLIRRVYLDLTGLPPSVSDVDAFLADKRPDAYERVVDRLLASPQYGERQARFWLDLARYADTDGFADLPRVAWKYRDWVIDAFNKNMPFDRFTIEQLAGDLLPGTDPKRFIATGFHRNSMFDAEMGGDPEEAHLNVIADRVSTTSTVWLGSTLQCARCHDHKYDPFSQKDFYAMAAFFSGTSSKPTNPGEAKGRWEEPLLPLPTAKQVSERQKLSLKVRQTEEAMKKWSPEKRAAMDAWKEKVKNPGWLAQDPALFARSGGQFKRKEDGSYIAVGPAADDDRYRLTFNHSGRVTGIRLEFLPDDSLPKKGSGRAGDGSFIIKKVAVMLDGQPIKLNAVAADYNFGDFAAENLLDEDSDGWATLEAETEPHELVLGFETPLELKPGSKLTLDILQGDRNEPREVIGRFRASLAAQDHPASCVVPAGVRKLMDKPVLEKKDQEKVETAFFKIASAFESQRKEIAKAKKALKNLKKDIPTAMILQEHAGKEKLKTPLRIRGEFVNKGPDVFADTPAVLPPLDKSRRVDRLALAKWLVSDKNPLTARVLANRLWEQSFGRGLVATSEDFGVRGSVPTHPELLDWMAVRLQHGWNVKAMQRQIVTSATYRQASRASAKSLEDDPKNLLLARGPKVRMDAETVRDASLSFGGLLYKKIGGPSVFPYQPSESTENNVDWKESYGRDAYRRSLYTFLQRGYPYPLFQLFDAASRSECTARRVNTTTPLQALALMNDKAMVEAADSLGRRMMCAAANDEARLAFGFRICTSRRPSGVEMGHLKRLLSQLRKRYKDDPKLAKELSGTPERSAWAMVGNVLLNMDETINRN